MFHFYLTYYSKAKNVNRAIKFAPTGLFLSLKKKKRTCMQEKIKPLDKNLKFFEAYFTTGLNFKSLMRQLPLIFSNTETTLFQVIFIKKKLSRDNSSELSVGFPFSVETLNSLPMC